MEEKEWFEKRCFGFFGLRPGQTETEFKAELAALADHEREELQDALNREGTNSEPPATAVIKLAAPDQEGKENAANYEG